MTTIFIILGIALIVLSVAANFFLKKVSRPRTVIGVVAGIVFLIIAGTIVIVPTGYTGVRTTFGQVSDTSISKGINFKIPIVQSINLVNNKMQDITTGDSEIWGESSEKTPVYATSIVVTYNISAEKSAWLYTNVTKNDKNLITESLISSAVKSAMVKFTTKDVTVRSKIEPSVKEQLQLSVNEKYGEGVITIRKVVINNMDFEQSYNDAIAAKSIAQETAEKQAIENKTAIEKAEADKTVEIKKAEAEAESKRIAAEAEAEANKVINESLNDNILKSKFYEKWDGKLPTVMGESASIVDIGDVSNDSSDKK